MDKERTADAMFGILRHSACGVHATAAPTLRLLCGAAGTSEARGSGWDALRECIHATRLAFAPGTAVGPLDAQAALCAGIACCQDKGIVGQLSTPLLTAIQSTPSGSVSKIQLRLADAFVSNLEGASASEALGPVKRWLQENIASIVALQSPCVGCRAAAATSPQCALDSQFCWRRCGSLSRKLLGILADPASVLAKLLLESKARARRGS